MQENNQDQPDGGNLDEHHGGNPNEQAANVNHKFLALLETPSKIVSNIVSFLGPGNHAFVAPVNSTFRLEYNEQHPGNFTLVDGSNITTVAGLVAAGYPPDNCFNRGSQGRITSMLSSIAARHGDMIALQTLLNHNAVFDSSTTIRACVGGQLEALQWLHQHGIQWNHWLPLLSLIHGTEPCGMWAIFNGCPVWAEVRDVLLDRLQQIMALDYDPVFLYDAGGNLNLDVTRINVVVPPPQFVQPEDVGNQHPDWMQPWAQLLAPANNNNQANNNQALDDNNEQDNQEEHQEEENESESEDSEELTQEANVFNIDDPIDDAYLFEILRQAEEEYSDDDF